MLTKASQPKIWYWRKELFKKVPSSFLSDYENLLSPYAARGSTSLGRTYPEDEHEYRSAFQRDRDRIVHTAAFRRLESKTQVYTNLSHSGDMFRKRLTHTIEVAQISRGISRALKLNEDLTEAVALAHDIGHSSFGHKGEVILNDLMKDNGGFDHNTQALRILCLIEHRYPEFPGLNLTYEVREGIASKGKGQSEPLKDQFRKFNNPTMEAQVVDISDPITYNTHDLDDGLLAKTIDRGKLKDCDFWVEGESAVMKRVGDTPEKILRFQVIRYLINAQVTDLLAETNRRVLDLKPKSPDDIRNHKEKVVAFSDAMAVKHKELKMFLRDNMYDHPSVKRMEHKARQVLTSLFDAFLKDPSLLPQPVQVHYKEAVKQGSEKRIVCDYIAGMTDRFANDEYEELFGHSSKRDR